MKRGNECGSGGGGVGDRASEKNSAGDEAEGSSTAAAGAGNRWSPEETVALLKIRMEMGSAFSDSSAKAALWDEASRRMAEIGYHRSAKKCKEKFENINKYHKRTKKDHSTRSDGKTYRFFNQLEALDHQELSLINSAPERNIATNTAKTTTATQNADPDLQITMPTSVQNMATSSSGEEYEGYRKRKRKWEDFFGRIMRVVLEKQEDLQKKFMEALDRCEHERVAREEAWKTREMERIKREQELLDRERAVAAAKDDVIIAFLQKILDQGKTLPVNATENPSAEKKGVGDKGKGTDGNHGDGSEQSGSSRWPKEEVEALIKIRASMEFECQGDGAKGPLWKEISASMKKLGYDRNAKRCKEKWENMNKYFRRVKENKKKRIVDSKTCSYFQQLEALYSVKSQKADNNSNNNLRPEELLMHMMNHHRDQEGDYQSITSETSSRLIME